MALHILPYNLLFNIAQYLSTDDVHYLQATCKSLRSFTLTRPVYRALAHGLLARSRPLPLPAFQRLADLSTQNLIKAVDRAHRFEKAWRVRAPRPARSSFSLSAPGSATSDGQRQWYTKISAPPNEEIDWLSPITSSYTLCATKSGRVICWDVARDVCLAEWDPRTLAMQCGSGEHFPKDTVKGNRHKMVEDHDDDDDEGSNSEKKWELWKCRVEFDERAVYFTMARVLEGSYDDNRVMEFVLMKLAFPPDPRDYRTPAASPLLQPSTITPESHYSSLLKSPATSPPASQGSSPQDSTLHTSGGTEYTATILPPSSPILGRTIPPSPDYTEFDRETLPRNTICPCPTTSLCPFFPSNRCMPAMIGTRASLRATFAVECPPMEPTPEPKPDFFPLTSFHTTGVVMNVFLLDPPRRLLSAFVWVASSNTIGLYVLLDWAKDEYVFVDTGVGCIISSNWSCILHEDQIVIHSEEADAAYQHFYPLNTLRNFSKPRRPSLIVPGTGDNDFESTNYDSPLCRDNLPMISTRLPPIKSISKKFVFPTVVSSTGPDVEPVSAGPVEAGAGEGADNVEAHESSLPDIESEQLGEGPSSSTVSVGNLDGETNEEETSFDDEHSEYETGEEDEWPQEAVEEGSRAKGKARAEENDVLGEDETGLLSPLPSASAKGKGKMREVDSEEHSEDEHHSGLSSRTLSSSSPQTETAPNVLPPPAVNAVVSDSATTPLEVSTEPAPNPYPFPPWYPESAHFVRQWWPTLPGVPRLSCTVVLLAAHDANTHRTRFVLAQHYFRVPIVRDPPAPSEPNSSSPNSNSEEDRDDEMLHLWYVSTPFEVVCVLDSAGDHGDEDDAGDRPRPLVAVDFGHAVWVEYAAEPGGVYGVDASRLVGDATFVDSDDEVEDDAELFDGMSDDGSGSESTSASNGHHYHGSGGEASTNPHDGDGTIFDPRRHRVPKCLRFVTFPPVFTAVDHGRGKARRAREEAVVRTLEIPDELDLDGVETINIDQSQGAVILSVKEGNIFILRYE
ncbi:hypothetical protein BS17DRAFT_811543 [Gyrodon lividus]|nr:hypothetical protein BS17DRAFT_811543 [Gyrodon lividus]